MIELSYFETIIILVFIILVSSLLGYFYGSIKSITDDLKSLDYDRLKDEYNELLRTINTIDDVKHNKYKRF